MIDDRYSKNGVKIFTLASERVSLSIMPELGGVITSIKYLPNNL